VHLYARQLCTARCAESRRRLRILGGQFRQYWFDRKRGIKPMPREVYRLLYGDSGKALTL
jgi:hypothetical protein